MKMIGIGIVTMMSGSGMMKKKTIGTVTEKDLLKENQALRKENKELKTLVAKLEKLAQELEQRPPVDPWEPCFRMFRD